MPKNLNKKRWFEQNFQDGLFADLDKSPLPEKDEALPPHGPRLPKPFPPADWAKEMRAYARGEKSSWSPGAEELQLKADRAELEKALRASDPNERAVHMAKVLNTQLESQYKGRVGKRVSGYTQHPAEARIQRAHLSLESLLAAGKDLAVKGDRKAVLLAINALTPEKQTDLLRADETSGRRLYSALYVASQEDEELKSAFAQVKGAAQLARVGARLDSHDASGETNAIVNGVLRHLDQAGLADQEQNAFIDKLNFKLTIKSNQNNPDIPLPETGKPGWREKFAARTLSILAETPAVSDESIEGALDLPEGDLVKVLGHAYTGPADSVHNSDAVRREGDMRLARVARSFAAKKENTGLQTLLEGLENNYFDRRLMLREAQKENASVKQILKTLEEEASKEAEELAAQAEEGVQERLAILKKKLEVAKENIRKDEEKKKGEPDKNLAKQLKVLEEAQRIIQSTKLPTKAQTLALMKRFGRYAVGNLAKPGKEATYDADKLREYAEFLRQTEVQVAAIENPLILKEGLLKSSYVLPTAGKRLKDCPWLQSTAEDLARVATSIREKEGDFTLKDHPIIVLDQTDGNGVDEGKKALWQANHEFLEKLESEYKSVGLTIKHISMGNIQGMIKGSGIEKLFDTTGEANAGYGGCRNITFLLGPVIQAAVRKGEDLDAIKPEELAKRIKESALTNAPKLFMGDDTDYIAPGTVAAKASLAASEHYKDYSLIKTARYGRDTQGVTSAWANGAVDQLESGGLDLLTAYLYEGNKWALKNTAPGMGCSFGEPRFCLDLPTNAEERQCESASATKDHFAQASHLSGDRQNAPSAFLKSYMAYSNMTETVKAFIPVPTVLPWNAAAVKRRGEGKPFSSLQEVMGEAADTEKRKDLQKNVLTSLVAFNKNNGMGGGPLQLDGNQALKVQEYLDKHPEIDAETKDELTKIKTVYEDGKRQAQLIKRFTGRLLEELKLPVNPSAVLDKAIERSLEDLESVQKAIKKVRAEMMEDNVVFNAGNSMLRDFALVLESTAGGGFSDLCKKLAA
jgi:hypothetical protein